MLALTLVIAGCIATPATDDDPVTTVATTSAPVPGSYPGIVAADAQHEESPSLSSTTTLTTATTETPVTAATATESPVIATDFDLDELDDLLDDLSGILGDLEQSLAEEEGDIFDD